MSEDVVRVLGPRQAWDELSDCCQEAAMRAVAPRGAIGFDDECMGCCEWMGPEIWAWSKPIGGYVLTDFARQWLAEAGVVSLTEPYPIKGKGPASDR